jgi:hypothetical protein
MMAQHTKQWRRAPSKHIIKEKPQLELPLHQSLYAFNHFLNRKTWLDQELENIPHLYLSYEPHLKTEARHQATANPVFNFLGLNTINLVPSDFRPTYKTPYSQMISNYQHFMDAALAKGLIENTNG